MKYKVGDKVLIEGEIKCIDSSDCNKYPYKVLISGCLVTSFSEDELRDATKTYEDGLDDAWELVKKLADMSFQERADIFGYCRKGIVIPDILKDFTPQEALAKIEAYEKSQHIQVGDVVRFKDSKTELLITSVARELNGIHIQSDECGKVGEVHSGICRKDVEKTGKHLDIEHLLEQIRGNE